MAGYRFAADPQSGWLYAPPTALFSTLSPGLALRSFIVFNPLLAGLGTLRVPPEGVDRSGGATAGGLVLAMMVSTSTIAISLPFAGALAWTTVLLLAAAGLPPEPTMVRAARVARARRLRVEAGGCGAHESRARDRDGVRDRLPGRRRRRRRASRRSPSARSAVGPVALFLVVLPLAALPILVPHVDFLGASSLRAATARSATPGSRRSAIRSVRTVSGRRGRWGSPRRRAPTRARWRWRPSSWRLARPVSGCS